MDKYKYKIKTSSGDIVKDIMYAENIDELNRLISSTGSTLISYKKYTPKKEIFVRKIKSEKLGILCQQLSIMMRSGLSIVKSISTILDSISDAYLKKVLLEIVKDLQMGVNFSSCLEKYSDYFPNLFIMMIRVAEISGNMIEVLEYLRKYYMNEHTLKQKVVSSMIYPIILFSVTIIIFFALMLFIIPQFETTFLNISSSDMPFITKIIFGLSHFFRNYLLIILLVILVLVLILLFFINKKNSKFKDWLKLKTPIIGKINKWVITSRFIRSLSMMYHNGISLTDAFVESSKIINNKCLKDKMDNVINNIMKGRSIALSLREIKFFPTMFVEMIAIGENTNHIGEVFKVLADYYDSESDASISKITSFLEPVIIIIIAIIVSLVIIAIFIPMFSMMDSVMEV